MLADKFACPACGAFQSWVIDSRPDLSGLKVIRRRKCVRCASVYVTAEIRQPPEDSLDVVQPPSR